MISHLRGGILTVTEKYVLVDVSGVGYRVFCTSDFLAELSGKTEVALHTYLAVREDALDLYGFPNEDDLGFFELLISVSGIGPKSALGILGITSTDALRRAIATGDTSYLTKVSGIGRKTAEKIVLELRDKLVAHANADGKHSLRAESDAVLALQSLGYSQAEARDALKHVPSEVTDTNARIKEALKILGQK
jgi:Holliday junction DNA helicase RuvA